MSQPTRFFPIMGQYGVKLPPIPWDMIAPHEEQAQRFHSQTLQRLAERGGLSPCEAIAVLEDRNWKPIDDAKAQEQLYAMVEQWKADAEDV